MTVATLGISVNSGPAVSALGAVEAAAKRAGISAQEMQARIDRASSGAATAGNRLSASAKAQNAALMSASRAASSHARELANVATGTQKASAAAATFGSALGGVERIARGAVGQLAAMAAASVGLVTGLRTLAQFENSMAAVGAITRSSAEELAALRDVAKDLGAKTEFTSSQAADGLKFLGMAGWSAAQSIAAIPAVLDLATAAQMDLARAADISSNIMSAFGIAADDARQVADVLAAAASRANTDIFQLGDAMKYAGPVASALGISMGDVAAAIGVLSDAGLQGTMAGTGLRQVMSSLVNPTGEARRTLQALGLTLGEVNPKANELTAVVKRLGDAGLDATTAFRIFGARGANSILALISGQEKLNSLTETLRSADGEAKRMADTMRDSLMGAFKELDSGLEAVVIALGEAGLTRAVTSASLAAAGAFRSIADNMDQIVKAAGIAGVAMMAAFGPAIVSAIGAATRAIVLFNAALLRNPIGLAATAMASAALAAMKFKDSTIEIAGATMRLRDVMDVVWTAIIETINAAVKSLGGFAAVLWDIVKLDFGSAWNRAAEVDKVWTTAADNIAKAWDRAKRGISLQDNQDLINLHTWSPAGGTGKKRTPANDNDISDPGKSVDSFERAIASARKHIAAMEADARAVGLSAGEHARLRTEAQLLEAAQRSGGAVTDAQRKQIEALGEAAKQAADNLARARAASDISFGRQTAMLSQQDVQIAQALRDIYGNDVPAALASSEAAAMRMNDAMRDLAGSIESSISTGLSDLVSGSKSAKDAFSDMADGIVKAIQKMIIQMMIVQPLMRGLQGALGGIFGPGAPLNILPNALGGVFPANDNGISRYSNQIVSHPTIFPFARGVGLMGEAGPEAIMPLKRAPDGSLGVSAQGGRGGAPVINIINQSSGKVEQGGVRQNADGSIDVFIRDAVRGVMLDDVAKDGDISRAMSARIAGFNGR